MIIFKVPGMKCGGCARRVTAALKGADPSAAVQVDLQRREVTVTSIADGQRLGFALREAGYAGEIMMG